MFAGVRAYRGSYRFSKHFTGWDQVAAFDGVDDGEELSCAKRLDSLTEVKHWIRNVPRHPNAFWLPMASGKFYPDFVAELTDERILVVEYKGGASGRRGRHRRETCHRQALGDSQRWQGAFPYGRKLVDGKEVRVQMRQKLASRSHTDFRRLTSAIVVVVIATAASPYLKFSGFCEK